LQAAGTGIFSLFSRERFGKNSSFWKGPWPREDLVANILLIWAGISDFLCEKGWRGKWGLGGQSGVISKGKVGTKVQKKLWRI
jgi:hypothetical protein